MDEYAADRDRIFAILEEGECHYCGGAEMVREPYKGSPAVVCSDCDTPQVRFFASDQASSAPTH